MSGTAGGSCVVCGDPDCFGPSGRHRLDAAPPAPAGDGPRTDTADPLVARIAAELWRHGDTMSRAWSDNDAEPVTVELGCRCGFVRGVVTAAEMAADLPGWLRKHYEHVASEIASLAREQAAEELEAEAAWELARALEGKQ